ncbi:hypothetical protein SAMN06297387_12378 [Streptomyces zhaozhouensis]|uniref:SAF domain-containing protein n=1 Tax=Streptomyces zhaozhouensis TaxID=1300267 RepID=A0A286E4M4_9ACTN|nr:hypothetical protein [Streptomyces zhaozhouensis]SOD65843.1 hypothetical protein SAMN06297387_12378 [Streptomyces zhaozhouensis]
MRTEDRVSTAAKKSIAVGPVAGDRLPAPPRERKPALAALAALLVLVGALGATILVMRAGDRVEAIRITERVPMGQRIPESAMEPVLVAEDDAVSYVRWEQRGTVMEELRPTTDLVGGTVLVGEMLTGESTLPEGEVMVGVSLQPGQYPTGLEAGDTVAAYWVGDDGPAGETGESGQDGARSGPETLLTDSARVAAIHGDGGGGGNSTLPVTLRVEEAVVSELTSAAAAGDVSLVVVAAPAE